MSRKGFWFGLIAGVVLMGLLAATIGAAAIAFRWLQGGMLPMHGQGFGFGLREGAKGFGFRGWGPGRGGHWKPFGFGALLCLHVPLLALGGLFVAAMVGRWACWPRPHFHRGHWGRHKAWRPHTDEAAPQEDADQRNAKD